MNYNNNNSFSFFTNYIDISSLHHFYIEKRHILCASHTRNHHQLFIEKTTFIAAFRTHPLTGRLGITMIDYQFLRFPRKKDKFYWIFSQNDTVYFFKCCKKVEVSA
jgi:hypothetical protein